MTITTLNERIAKAKEKVKKKTITMEKKEAKLAEMPKDEDGMKYRYGDSFWLSEDIKRLAKEIEATKATIAKYEKQLAGEMEKESLFATEIPEAMKSLQDELVKRWDEYDKEHRDRINQDRKEMDYKAWCRKYSRNEICVVRYKTDEQIHKDNINDAKVMILDLYNRVKAITGEVTDWRGIHASGTALNGFVIGKEGRAEVESILAGGYNIQRLHVRVLVKSRD